jgi:thioredoxin 1
MAVDATPETYGELVADGNVLVDFWGPRCQPCLALMPAVEALEHEYGDRLRLVKVNAPEARQVCRDLRVLGLPTYLLYRDGVEVDRLTGDPSKADIEAAVKSLVEGGE